jgi:6-pyruvoyl-tetrahydropterin synthase
VNYSFLTQHSFDSTHQSDEPERCRKPHGHRFTVVANVEHEQLDDGMPRGARGFDDAVHELCVELDHKPLSEMMPGMQQTLPGMAAYFFERLAKDYPGLKSVGVFDGTSTGTVERT